MVLIEHALQFQYVLPNIADGIVIGRELRRACDCNQEGNGPEVKC